MKLLESITTLDNNVAQQVEDGALMNFQTAEQRNGLIWGCGISSSANVVYIDPGLLMVRGYRLKIEQREVLYDFNRITFPSGTITKYISVRITRTNHDASYTILMQDASDSTGGISIEKAEGSFTYRLVKVELDYNGIRNITSVISTITPGGASSGSSGSGVAVTIPEPQLELVADMRTPLYGAYLCLANKGDYSKFSGSYLIKFEMYRYVSKGQYRKRSGTQKLYTYKTGYVQPLIQNGEVAMGWRGFISFKTSINYSELKSQLIAERGTYSYSRNNVIEKISNYVDDMFYEATDLGPVEVTTDSNPRAIRATRSKTTSAPTWLGLPQGTKVAKHNFFRFAFKAVAYDQNNKKVAESGLSRAVLIRPNVAAKSEMTTRLGELFKITII